MEAPNSKLFNMLVEDLNSSFLRQYAERTNIIYKEAESRSYKDAAVHEAYKPYHYGQTRFTLHQSMFLKLADDCGVEWYIDRCPQNGFPTAVVKMGRFFFTDHYGATPDEVTCLNASLMRQQSSEINLSLIQGDLFSPSFDDSKLTHADSVYGNLIHGCRGAGADFTLYGFLRIALPCATKAENNQEAERTLRFVENHNMYDVLARVVERENQTKAAQPKVNVVMPKVKVSR